MSETKKLEAIHQSGHPLLQSLLEAQKLTLEQAKQIKDKHPLIKGSLTALICKLGFLSEKELVSFIATQEELEIVPLETLKISEETLLTVPHALIEEYKIFPVEKSERMLTLAMSDPNDFQAVQQVISATNCRIEIVLAYPSVIEKKIQECYSDVPEPIHQFFQEAEINRDDLDRSSQFPQASSIVPAILQQFKEEHFEFTEAQFKSIKQLSEEAVPLLIRALQDTEDRVRIGAAWVLSELGPEAKSAVSALIVALQSKNNQLRNNVVLALSKIGAGPEAIPALKKALQDELPSVRRIAAEALTKITGEPFPADVFEKKMLSASPLTFPFSPPLVVKPIVPANLIIFYCKNCQSRFDVTSDKVGKLFICNQCLQKVRVPDTSELPPELNELSQPKVSSLQPAISQSGLHRKVQQQEHGNTSDILVKILVPAFLFLLVLYFMKPNSSKHSQESTDDPESQGNPSEQVALQNKLKEDEAEKKLKATLQQFPRESTPYQRLLQEYQKLAPRLAGTKAEIRLERLILELTKEHSENARLLFEAIKSESESILVQAKKANTQAEASQQFLEALSLWTKFPIEFEGTSYWPRSQFEIEKIKILQNNKKESLSTVPENSQTPSSQEEQAKKHFSLIYPLADKLLTRAKIAEKKEIAVSFLEEAIEIWNTFPEDYRDTESGKIRQQALQEIQQLQIAWETTENTEAPDSKEQKKEVEKEPDLALPKLHGTLTQDQEQVTLVYSFSKPEELQDFRIEEGNFTIKNFLIGQGTLAFKDIRFREFELTLEFYHNYATLRSGILFGMQNRQEYFELQFHSEKQSCVLGKREKLPTFVSEKRSFQAMVQSVALFSYVRSGKNVLVIRAIENQIEIILNKKRVFKLNESAPLGSIGLYAYSIAQFGKLKITGKVR